MTEACNGEDDAAIPAAGRRHLQTVTMQHLLLHLRRCDVAWAKGETARHF